jgi:hypothetical protein
VTTTAQPETHTLNVPGATLTYDVRRNPASAEPVLNRIANAGKGTRLRG